MRHAPLRVSLVLATLSALAACKVKDPLYCDSTTPCTDPERPFCDLEGAYPASEGIRKTCIPNPFDASPGPDAGPACTPGEWTLDTIDDRNVVPWPTLAVDDTGVIHIAYAIGDPAVLQYARGRAGSWQLIETPDVGGFYPQMAIDSSATLHLVHGGWTGGLRYLHKDVADDEFEYELVASPLAYDIGFALDASEEPTACFFDGESGGPAKCYSHGGGEWTMLEPPRPEPAAGISLAFDSSNTLHFVADGVAYFSRTGGDWSSEESVGNGGAYPSVAVDSDGVPHVAYSSNGIVHAYRAGADDWNREPVEGVVDGDAATIFVDSTDALHVAYVDTTNSNLKYARREGGSWETKTVDPGATVPVTPKLFIDASGVPHIVYFDSNDGDLRYAYLCP